MTYDPGKKDTSGKPDPKKGRSDSARDTRQHSSGKSEPDLSMTGSLKRFYNRHLGPQGEEGHYTIVHDVLVAVIVVLVILLAIYGYTKKWPPVVVVESGSMQHDMDESALGVIDTGDIVMVKDVSSVDDITTWSIGKEKNYKTYGEYGDVIIYDKNGEGGTPVIHRAIVFIHHNITTPGGIHYFDVPEWNIYHERTIEYYIEELGTQIKYTPPRGHDGYLTKGDNRQTNRNIDQQSGISDEKGRIVEQVSIEWVVGVARGEVPWFGLIKLNINDNPGYETAPDNSKTNLKVSLVLLLGVPIALNVLYYVFAMKYGTLDEDDGKEGKDGKKPSSSRSVQTSGSSGSSRSSGGGKEKQHSSRMDKVKVGRK